MTVDRQFLVILDGCITAVKKYSDINTYPQYALYKDRYKRILQYTENLKDAINKGILAKDFWSLEITKMIDRNDPEDIKSNVLDANQFYCKNYQQL